MIDYCEMAEAARAMSETPTPARPADAVGEEPADKADRGLGVGFFLESAT